MKAPAGRVTLDPWQHRVVEMMLDQQNRHHLIIWGHQCGKTAIRAEVMRRLAERAKGNPPDQQPKGCDTA